MQIVRTVRMNRFVILSLLAALGLAVPSAGVKAQAAKQQEPRTAIEAAISHMGQAGSLWIHELAPAGEVLDADDKKRRVHVTVHRVRNVTLQKEAAGFEVVVKSEGYPDDRAYIDIAELPAVLSALDYLRKFDPKTARTNAVRAGYTTKGGFMLINLSINRSTPIAVFHAGGDLADISFAIDKFDAFEKLLIRGREIIDGVKK